MSLKGLGFLAIWTDIQPEYEDEFNGWHIKEHIPERVSTLGFLRGRRFVNNESGDLRYFVLYEGENPEVFHSKEYIRKLNSPTPLTQKIMPAFRNFTRTAFSTLYSDGNGIGGTLATILIEQSVPNSQPDITEIKRLTNEIFRIEGITGVHVGLANHDISSVETKEKEMRINAPEDSFDILLLIEGQKQAINKYIASIHARIESSNLNVNRTMLKTYHLDFMLTSEEC